MASRGAEGDFAEIETMKGQRYRVAVIGHTGHGNYGHGHDLVWRDVPQAEVVAVADASPSGLRAALERLGVDRATRITGRCWMK